MKNFMFCMVLALGSAQAFAASESVSISCAGDSTESGSESLKYQPMTLTLSASTLYFGKGSEATMHGVVVAYANDEAVEMGRAKYLESDEKYKPRKYKNHVRFDMSKLTETEEFDQYMPGDTCVLNVLVPKNAMSVKSFKAPVIVNCDQSGGTMTLDCETKEND